MVFVSKLTSLSVFTRSACCMCFNTLPYFSVKNTPLLKTHLKINVRYKHLQEVKFHFIVVLVELFIITYNATPILNTNLQWIQFASV